LNLNCVFKTLFGHAPPYHFQTMMYPRKKKQS